MPTREATISKELKAIGSAFEKLAQSFSRLGPVLARPSSNGTGVKPPAAKRRISPKRRAAMKLQGRYMGALRGLKSRQRARVKKIRVEKGIRAAITEASKMVE